MSRVEFRERFQRSFKNPLFARERAALERVEDIAWNAYSDKRKAPRTRKAGEGYADPEYDLSVEWIETRDRVRAADAKRDGPDAPSRVLLVVGAPRNDGSCPVEMSKTYRLMQLGREIFEKEGFEADVLDLSLLTSEYGKRIYPCKGCSSTAMPLCHWPCSCYPNHALGQTGDWMAEIYKRWTAAHGVVIYTPVHWYQVPSALKLMMDRLACADGGNPDPTSTSGKDAEKAKAVSLPAGLTRSTSPDVSMVSWSTATGANRGRAPITFRLARLNGSHRRGIEGSAGSLHRLLRALCDKPRCV